jgi:hypothetical protein
LPLKCTRRLILQKARHHPVSRALTDCRHTVSDSISLPSPGFFSPFPHGTAALSVVGVFSLGRWSSRIPAGFLVPCGTQVLSQELPLRVRGYHPLWPAFPRRSTRFHSLPPSPTTPLAGFRLFRVRSPLLTEFFLFLWLLRCFSSPGSLSLRSDVA